MASKDTMYGGRVRYKFVPCTAVRYFRASVARTIAQRINGIVVSTTTHRVHSRRSLK